MNHSPLLSLALLALTTNAAHAQVVSPPGFATQEGNTSNNFPFTNSSFSYQQGHPDLRGNGRTISAMAFRRDGIAGTTTGLGPRAFTLDIYMGGADVAAMSTAFSANFTGAPTQVMTNRIVNAPDHGPQASSAPAPFTFVITLDTPYVFSGALDLLWELRMTANTNTAGYTLDAASGTGTSSGTGAYQMLGTGCTTNNRTMEIRSAFTTTTALHTLRWNVTGGPSTAQCAVLVGLPLNVQLPNLCGSGTIYTTASVLSLAGSTNSSGSFSTPTGLTVPTNPFLFGFTLAAQAVAQDITQGVFPIAVSNGVNSQVPTVNPPVPGKRLYSSGNPSAVTGTLANNYNLVTEFR